ncbi:O-antigen translocase [Jejuia pallidilutea]|uniref:Lipopolysaccharide biosynthesis protein n=1 Tax=Jejuia pallidilutea TaxID=504487 RepID=A0A090VNF1_9FLAO|nr:O-antigen translocase [Jejuia pallidilutea]PQV48207.1 PST family polysaccharide transporter [Jejuia pallidilutea]GAL66246.1 lipopolysaccharide biosynthesis protein [Jejuia pallidilutea]GAL88267.1 lipopolysaccharide biosynthesis protein [Jejuia pallidilutea]
MKKLIRYINSKVLVKAASLKTAAVFTRVIAGLLTSKAIAVMIGAEGLALVGNLRNFVASAQTLATLGFYKGVVRYVNDFKDDLVKLSKTLSTVYYAGFITTILVSFICYFKADVINELIFPTYNDYVYIIKIFAIVLPFYALNMFTFSIMNGFSKYKILIIINIIGQILSLCVALLLIYQKNLDGALISVAISESLIFLITLVGIINRKSLVPLISVEQVSFTYIKKLSSYTGMALFSAVILPLVILAIRSHIIDTIGYKDAGFWEAMLRISKYYLMMVSSLLGLYIIPRFSEINDIKEFKKEVFSLYKTVVPYFILGLVLIYVLRPYIVWIVFTEEFKPVEDLFLWQLLGDFVKVLSMIIAYQFLAKKMFWHYVITEAFLVIILYTTSIYFIKIYGVKGAVIGHFVSYLMYYGVILLIFGSSLFGVESDKNNFN